MKARKKAKPIVAIKVPAAPGENGPLLEHGTVITGPSFVTDRRGANWWIDPETKLACKVLAR